MSDTSVHALLLQHFRADRTASRLLAALGELSARVESAERRQPCSSWHATHPSSLQLPDPAAGPLPCFPGASEHAALQAAAEAASLQLRSTSERQAWRSWLMSPHQLPRVVEVAWLLVARVFRQDACAAALQEHVLGQVQRHHVAALLAGPEPVPGAAGSLWCEAMADAACRLLRAAFPGAPELEDPHLQALSYKQLRLFITGVLPSDAAAACLAAGSSSGASSGGCSRPQKQQVVLEAAAGQRCVPFVTLKPSPCLSTFLSRQGIRPAAQLLQQHPAASAVTRVTVPASLMAAEQEQLHEQHAPGHKAAADTCLAAAGAAAAAYATNKQAGAAAAKAGSLALRREAQRLLVQRERAIAAGASHARNTSNRVSGWLSEAGASVVAVAPSSSAAADGKTGLSSSGSSRRSLVPSDVSCKAHRQLMEGRLGPTERRLAHSLNPAVHNACLDLAAAVAVLPPAPVTRLSATAPQDWGALIRLSVVRSRLATGGATGGSSGGSRSSTGSSIKTMKAARALVEDVQRLFGAGCGGGAAGSGRRPPRGRL